MEEEFVDLDKDIKINRSMILGCGQFGTVYKGFRISDSRFIAIKFIPQYKVNPKILEREIRIL